MTKEERKKYNKEWYQKNKNKVKDYQSKNIDKILVYRKLNKSDANKRSKEWYQKNKEKKIIWESINKEKRNEYQKLYKRKKRGYNGIKVEKKIKSIKYKLTIEQRKERRNERIRTRLKTDNLFKVKKNIRSLISSTIKNKGIKKSLKSEQILGCSFEEFKRHLENQFEPWMNWENYGNPKDKKFELNKTWDIDHVIPVTSAITEEQLIELNHYTNLKPLCSYINRWVKGSTH